MQFKILYIENLAVCHLQIFHSNSYLFVGLWCPVVRFGPKSKEIKLTPSRTFLPTQNPSKQRAKEYSKTIQANLKTYNDY